MLGATTAFATWQYLGNIALSIKSSQPEITFIRGFNIYLLDFVPVKLTNKSFDAEFYESTILRILHLVCGNVRLEFLFHALIQVNEWHMKNILRNWCMNLNLLAFSLLS